MVKFGFPTIRKAETPEQMSHEGSLESIWGRAEALGSVSIYSSRDQALPNRYQATITFGTITGTSLKADSDFRMPLKAALLQAIGRAEIIRGQFK